MIISLFIIPFIMLFFLSEDNFQEHFIDVCMRIINIIIRCLARKSIRSIDHWYISYFAL